ncbi:predicted nucleotide-utilizing enzyme, partial [Paenibacillus popilliae ATCC 14706]
DLPIFICAEEAQIGNPHFHYIVVADRPWGFSVKAKLHIVP